jgi:hypothetical protein
MVVRCAIALLMPIWSFSAFGQTVIPAQHGTTLNGQKVDLPEALRGKIGVLVVSFSQGSKEQVTLWGKRLFDDYHQSGNVAYYQIPELAGVPKFLRGFVAKKIGEGIPEVARGQFLPIFDHEAEWKSVAGYNKPDDAYVLLVDDSGVVLWKFAGPATDASYAEMKRRVDALRK